MTVYGYARVTTEVQDVEPQLAALRAPGCTEIVEGAEHYSAPSGTDCARPELARLAERSRRRR